MPRSSQRPRDALGRPLNAGDPRACAQVPDRTEVGGPQAWAEGLAYVDRGFPFHAHEVFEQRWKCCPESERDCWQALAQWGAALTQQARQNDIGRTRLAVRALDRLRRAQGNNGVPEYVDTQRVEESLAQLA